MLSADDLLLQLERLPIHQLSLFIPPLMLEQNGKVIHASKGGRRLGAESLLPQLERLPIHRLGLFIPPLVTEQNGEIVHAGKSVGMLGAEGHLRQLERLPVHRLGLRVLPQVNMALGHVEEKTALGLLLTCILPEVQGCLRMWQIPRPYVSVHVFWKRKRIDKSLYHTCVVFLLLFFFFFFVLFRETNQTEHIERFRLRSLLDERISLQNADCLVLLQLISWRQERCGYVFLSEEAHESQVLCSELVIPRDVVEGNQPSRGHRVLDVLVTVPVLELPAEQANRILVA